MRLILVAAMMMACSGTSNWVAYTPVNGKTAQAKPTAMQRATIAITDAGRDIESTDATTGIVLSKWFVNSDTTDWRFRIRVVLGDDGSYTVDALCQRAVRSNGGWGEGCATKLRPGFVVETVAKVEGALK